VTISSVTIPNERAMLLCMKVLICTDKFKGSISAKKAGEAISRGLHAVDDTIEVENIPIADGGEGFSNLLKEHHNGTEVSCPTVDPLGRPIRAPYILIDDSVILDMSAASGIHLLKAHELDPWKTSTYGTGLMIKHAVENHSPKRIIVGLGGSATTDGGVGMAAALGVKFLNEDQRLISHPTPEQLMNCHSVDTGCLMPLPKITAAADVLNILLGPSGASQVYGRQKGGYKLQALDATLAHIATVSGGERAAATLGSGAAGGLGFGLLHFANATIISGFDLISSELDIESKIKMADVIITGEGTLDSQTAKGKGPIGIATLARLADKPVYAIAGRIQDNAAKDFTRAFALTDSGLSPVECMARASELLMNQGRSLAGLLKR